MTKTGRWYAKFDCLGPSVWSHGISENMERKAVGTGSLCVCIGTVEQDHCVQILLSYLFHSLSLGKPLQVSASSSAKCDDTILFTAAELRFKHKSFISKPGHALILGRWVVSHVPVWRVRRCCWWHWVDKYLRLTEESNKWTEDVCLHMCPQHGTRWLSPIAPATSSQKTKSMRFSVKCSENMI